LPLKTYRFCESSEFQKSAEAERLARRYEKRGAALCPEVSPESAKALVSNHRPIDAFVL
jgi:hypothetical protein